MLGIAIARPCSTRHNALDENMTTSNISYLRNDRTIRIATSGAVEKRRAVILTIQTFVRADEFPGHHLYPPKCKW